MTVTAALALLVRAELPTPPGREARSLRRVPAVQDLVRALGAFPDHERAIDEWLNVQFEAFTRGALLPTTEAVMALLVALHAAESECFHDLGHFFSESNGAEIGPIRGLARGLMAEPAPWRSLVAAERGRAAFIRVGPLKTYALVNRGGRRAFVLCPIIHAGVYSSTHEAAAVVGPVDASASFPDCDAWLVDESGFAVVLGDRESLTTAAGDSPIWWASVDTGQRPE